MWLSDDDREFVIRTIQAQPGWGGGPNERHQMLSRWLRGEEWTAERVGQLTGYMALAVPAGAAAEVVESLLDAELAPRVNALAILLGRLMCKRFADGKRLGEIVENLNALMDEGDDKPSSDPISKRVAGGGSQGPEGITTADTSRRLRRKRLRRTMAVSSSVPEDKAPEIRRDVSTGLAQPHIRPEIQQLVDRITDVSVSLKDRIAAGIKLSELGDPRPGVGLRADGLPDIVWCDIPAGSFIFGGDPTAYNASLAETIDLPAFRVSKYPVTYSQFRSFVRDPDGYWNSRWWTGLHVDGHESRKGLGYQEISQYSNHPCERVSWYDSMAFCAWLTAKLGYSVMLPTEHQWEKAARGSTGLFYPYGNEFDALKSNTRETGIVRTSAVGIFLDGISSYGVADLSGNVWEWALTEYEPCVNTNANSDSRRVLRGGSWNCSRVGVRAASRGSYFPDSRNYGVGFRLASLPICFETLTPLPEILICLTSE